MLILKLKSFSVAFDEMMVTHSSMVVGYSSEL
jgi:hypothetical protein